MILCEWRGIWRGTLSAYRRIAETPSPGAHDASSLVPSSSGSSPASIRTSYAAVSWPPEVMSMAFTASGARCVLARGVCPPGGHPGPSSVLPLASPASYTSPKATTRSTEVSSSVLPPHPASSKRTEAPFITLCSCKSQSLQSFVVLWTYTSSTHCCVFKSSFERGTSGIWRYASHPQRRRWPRVGLQPCQDSNSVISFRAFVGLRFSR